MYSPQKEEGDGLPDGSTLVLAVHENLCSKQNENGGRSELLQFFCILYYEAKSTSGPDDDHEQAHVVLAIKLSWNFFRRTFFKNGKLKKRDIRSIDYKAKAGERHIAASGWRYVAPSPGKHVFTISQSGTVKA